MAGSIEIGAESHWSVAGWVFRNVLESTWDFLPETFPLKPKLEYFEEVAYLDVSPSALSASDRAAFANAALKAYRRWLVDGPTTWKRPEFYPGFIASFKELLDMIDPATVEHDEPVD